MIPPLSPELEQRIEEEANEAATTVAWSQETYDKFAGIQSIGNSDRYGPRVDPLRKQFFKKGAIPYAELWQEAEQRAERYEKALKWYADEGNYFGDNGELATAWKNKMPLKANEALTPKTTNDE